MSANWLMRRMIETASYLQRAGGPPLRRIRNADGNFVQSLGTVQTAGNTLYRRELQKHFPPASVDCKGEWPERKIYHIRQARVSGLCGSIFLPDNTLFSACPWIDKLVDKRVRRTSRLFRKHIDRPILHLMGRNHENHGHFLFEYLPRVLAAEPWLKNHPEWRIGVCGKHARWQRRYLELIGYNSERVFEFWQGTTCVKDLFYVPLLSGRSSLPDPTLLQATIDRLQKAASKLAPSISSPPDNEQVAFISRSDAPNKRLLNEADLIRAARNLFPKVKVNVLSGHSLEEQLKTMAQSALIIGPQGMGLSNMAFVRDRTLICLEAGNPPDEMAWEAAYCMIAELGGNKSLTLYGGQERIPPHRDWIYPVERFEREMRRLIKLLGKGLYNTTA